ncbi:LacI family DNA-binding transcriptional regulator [Streptomyces sp. NPDC102451]|uniref:LacI family DNA-binding transcriptional regulator n=1 Tax=Streptomyces sp. NPDC102451 TaxID=3366177 RepID=UPI00381C76D7
MRQGEKSAEGLGRRATIRDVAARADVSIATVSRVLSGKAAAGSDTFKRVVAAAKDLEYVVNAHARALVGSGPGSVAIVVPEFTASFFAQVCHGVEQQAAAEGRMCLICSTGGDFEREMAMVSMMREQGAEAIIVVGGAVQGPEYEERMIAAAHALDASGGRLVLCGRPSLGERVPASVVEYDNEGGSYAVTRHLLSAGHERILHLSGIPHSTVAENRLKGYRQALADHGIPYDDRLVFRTEFTRRGGTEAMRQALDSGVDFTAVYAGTDDMAASAMKVMRAAGLRVPEDISIVGYDDLPVASDLHPGLTSVHLPHEELGRTAVRMALHRNGDARDRQHVVLGTHIVTRDSVRNRARTGP